MNIKWNGKRSKCKHRHKKEWVREVILVMVVVVSVILLFCF